MRLVRQMLVSLRQVETVSRLEASPGAAQIVQSSLTPAQASASFASQYQFSRGASTSFPARKPRRLPSEAHEAASPPVEAPPSAPFDVHKAGAQAATAFMLPWERRQMAGGKLKTWEKGYWTVFVVCLAGLGISKLLRQTPKEPEIDEEKEARKVETARLALTGESVGPEFDGLSPAEIQEFVEKVTGASAADPFDGLSPEEINEYIEKHKPR